MTSKMHLTPGVMVNVFDVTVYSDGLKLSFADSPDGTERSAEPRGAFYLTVPVAKRLQGILNQLFPAPAPAEQETSYVKESTPDVAPYTGTKDWEEADEEPVTAVAPAGGVHPAKSR